MVGTRVEFAISQPPVFKLHRSCLRRPGCLLFEELRDRLAPRISGARVVPLDEDLASFARCQQRQFREFLVWIGGDGGQQRLQAAQHSRDGSALEQVGVVFQRGAESLRCFRHREGQIELGGPGFDLERLQIQLRPLDLRHRCVLQHKHHLEKWIAAQASLRVQLFDQLVERHFLMGKCSQRGFADPAEQFAEGGFASQVASKYQRVGEEADQFLDRRLVSPGDNRADQDVFLTGITVQQSLERREQRHEQGRSLLLAQMFERLGQRQRELQRLAAAAHRWYRRTWMIGGQFQRRRVAAQLPFPISQWTFQRRLIQPVPFPKREVAELNREFGQRRRFSGAKRFVKGRQLAEKNADRPAVGHDVVQGDHQHVLLCLQPDQ